MKTSNPSPVPPNRNQQTTVAFVLVIVGILLLAASYGFLAGIIGLLVALFACYLGSNTPPTRKQSSLTMTERKIGNKKADGEERLQ